MDGLLVWLLLSVYCIFSSITLISGSQRVTACYVTTWAQYRKGVAKFTIGDISPYLCTHIFYAFANIDEETLQLTPAEWNDVPTTWDKGNYHRLTTLKEKNPKLKIMLSVGGWKSGSKGFSAVVASKVTRQTFINNAIALLRQHKLDGLDMDWEYPGMRDSPREDSERYCQLLQEMRGAFDADTRGDIRKLGIQKQRLLLTTAVPSTKLILDSSPCLQRVSRYVDYVITPAYDYHGHWEWFAAHGSPLFSGSDDVGLQSTLNVNWTASVVAPLVGKEKLLLGLPLFAKTHLLEDPGQLTAGSPSLGPGKKGAFTGQPGMLAYYEVCKLLKGSWKSFWDRERSVPFAASGEQWVGYEDTRSIMLKALLARVKGLGGVALWALDLDDFRGRCGQGKYPLVTTVKKAFSQNPFRPQRQNQKKRQKTMSSSRTRRRRPRRDVSEVTGNSTGSRKNGSSMVRTSKSLGTNNAIGSDKGIKDIDVGLASPVIPTTPEVTMQTTFLQRPTLPQSIFSPTRSPSVTLTSPFSVTVQTRLVDIRAIVQYDFQLFDPPTAPTSVRIKNTTFSRSLRSLVEAFFGLLKAYVSAEDEDTSHITTVNEQKSPEPGRTKRSLSGKLENCSIDKIEADPSDCRYYYQCSTRKLYHFFCGPGAVFDPEVKTCVSPNTMEKCAGVSTVIEEPEDGDGYICVEDGYYRDPGDCNKFYRCTDNIKHFFSCPNGLVFSEDSSSCNFPSATGTCSTQTPGKKSGKVKENMAPLPQTESTLAFVQTTEESTKETDDDVEDDPSYYQHLAEPTKGSTQPHSDSQQYKITKRLQGERRANIKVQQVPEPINWLTRDSISDRKQEQPIRARFTTEERTTEVQLPEVAVKRVEMDSGTMEDPYELRVPDVTTNVGSKEAELTKDSSLFACPHNGYFRDSTDCRKFYHCANGMPYHVTCIGGLVFNHIKGICDWPQRVPDCRPTYRTQKQFTPEVEALPEKVPEVMETIHQVPSQDAPSDDATSGGFKQDGGQTGDSGEVHVTRNPTARKFVTGSNLPPVFPGYTPWKLVKPNSQDDTSQPTLMSPMSGAGSFVECDPPGFRPDPNDCRIFYICSSDGTEHRFRCAEELVFNLRKGYCEPPSRVPGCRRGATKRRIVKARGNHRRHLVTTPSTMTTSSVPVTAEVPPAGSVSHQSPTESSNHMVHQVAPPQIQKTDLCQPGVTRPHPFDCSHFFLCSKGGEWRMTSCSSGRVYNPSSSRCDSPTAVPACRFVRLRRDTSTNNKPTDLTILNDKQETVFPEETYESALGGTFISAAAGPEEGSPCAHMEEHLVADDSNCAYYFMCVRGHYLHMRCKQGLAFHPQLKLCDWVDSVPGCENEDVDINYNNSNRNKNDNNHNNNDKRENFSMGLSQNVKQDLNEGPLNDKTNPSETMNYMKAEQGELSWEAHGEGRLTMDGGGMERVNDQNRGWPSQREPTMNVAEITGFRCPYDGLFSHPYDCGLMYECIGRTQRVLKCPGGLVFNSRRRTCDNIHSVPECLTYKIEAPQFQALPVLYEYNTRLNLFYPQGGSTEDRAQFETGSGVIKGEEVIKVTNKKKIGPLTQTSNDGESEINVSNGENSSDFDMNLASDGHSKGNNSGGSDASIEGRKARLGRAGLNQLGHNREVPSRDIVGNTGPVANDNDQKNLKGLKFTESSWIGRTESKDPRLSIASLARNEDIVITAEKLTKGSARTTPQPEPEIWSEEGELLSGSIENLSHINHKPEKPPTSDRKQIENKESPGVMKNDRDFRGTENNVNFRINLDRDSEPVLEPTSFRHHVYGDYGHSGDYKQSFYKLPEAKAALNPDNIEEPLTGVGQSNQFSGGDRNQVYEENLDQELDIAKRLWTEEIRKIQGMVDTEDDNRGPPLAEFTCKRSGLFADPEDCQRFFECSSDLESTHVTCPELLVYNEHSGLCDHPINVPECYDGNLDFDPTADPNMMVLKNAEVEQPPNDMEADMQPVIVNGFPDDKELVGTRCIPGRPIPDPNDCSRYYHCITGGLQITYCPGELLFNRLTHRCDHPSNVPACGTMETYPDYSLRNDDVPSKHDVSSGHQWRVEGKQLPTTGMFSQQRKGSGVNCPEGGYVRDDHDCSIFYYCSGPIFYEFRCAAGLAFDSELLQCEWPSRVAGCGASS